MIAIGEPDWYEKMPLSLPAAEHLAERSVAQPPAIGPDRQLIEEALHQAVQAILIRPRPAPLEVGRRQDARVRVSVHVAPPAPERVRARHQQPAGESPIQLRLERVVLRLGPGPGLDVRRSAERKEERPAVVAREADDGRGVLVVARLHVVAAVADVGDVEREAARQLALERDVEGMERPFVRVRPDVEVGRVAQHRRARIDDPVRGNLHEHRIGEPGAHRSRRRRKVVRRVEHVVLLHRVVVDVGVVRERQRAHAVAAAQHRLVVQAVGGAGARAEVLQVLLHADALADVAVAGDLQRVRRRIVVRQPARDPPGRRTACSTRAAGRGRSSASASPPTCPG